MQWPEFKTPNDRYLVTCPYCGKDICYTHPPSGRGRHPPSFLNHLSRCNPSLTCRERYQVAGIAWAKRSEVAA
jgi:hypothetical protein